MAAPIGALRVVELYSGIGGMHCALQESELRYEVVAAADINPVANQVYRKNFPHTQLLTKCLLRLTAKELDGFNMDLLLMSPPCQPFTEVGKGRDVADMRTKSLLHILDLLPAMLRRPRYILLENVRGFERSTARQRLVDVLKTLNYTIQELMLSPVQFGVPNSRLRYFLLARGPTATANSASEQQLSAEGSGLGDPSQFQCPVPVKISESCMEPATFAASWGLPAEVAERHSTLLSSQIAAEQLPVLWQKTTNENTPLVPITSQSAVLPTNPIVDYISCDWPVANSVAPQSQISDQSASSAADNGPIPERISLELLGTSPVLPLSIFLEDRPPDDDYWERFLITLKFYRQFWVMDIVNSRSTGSCCFTKRYGHYIEGAGSVVQMGDSQQDLLVYKGSEESDQFISGVAALRLRFFTPREISNLLCFPQQFVLPSSLTNVQCYRLLGNSLNVRVVSFLLRHLIVRHNQ